jgi:hypothetical protein
MIQVDRVLELVVTGMVVLLEPSIGPPPPADPKTDAPCLLPRALGVYLSQVGGGAG